MLKGYSNIKQDNELIAAGSHFFCNTCLVARPLDDRSPDPRYCNGCYQFLQDEAALLPLTKRPKWLPKAKNSAKKTIPVSQDAVLNMSTINAENSQMDIIHSMAAKVTCGKRGPKHRELPVEQIIKLAKQGIGSRAIATRLAKQGISVSYKTIQRIITGERVMV